MKGPPMDDLCFFSVALSGIGVGLECTRGAADEARRKWLAGSNGKITVDGPDGTSISFVASAAHGVQISKPYTASQPAESTSSTDAAAQAPDPANPTSGSEATSEPLRGKPGKR